MPQGKLAVMLAGPQAALDDVMPVFNALSGKLFHVGHVAGQGQAMKLVNNLLGAAALAITAEGMVLGVNVKPYEAMAGVEVRSQAPARSVTE